MPDTTEKKIIPRGPAATAAKNKYRDHNYDRMELAVPKGMKARIKELCCGSSKREVPTRYRGEIDVAERMIIETVKRMAVERSL